MFDPRAWWRTKMLEALAGRTDIIPPWQSALADGDDAGYIPADGATWAVHGGMSPLGAGVRALLTQALHPGALAGVREHSRYREDPLGRLQHTIRWIYTVTYGDTSGAREATGYVEKAHRGVVGNYVDGHGDERPYAASDPDLLRWVHIAFADAFLGAMLTWGGEIPGGADRYVEEWAVAGELMGVVNPPRTYAELEAQLRGYYDAGELRGGPDVEELVGFLRTAPFDPALKIPYRLLFAGSAASMRSEHRELLGFDTTRDRLLRGPSIAGARIILAGSGAVLGGRSPSERFARERLERIGAA